MSADFGKLLRLLVESEIDFIVIGGVAAIVHGSARATFDLDVVYDRRGENIKRIVDAIKPFSPYLRGVPPGLPFVFDEKTVKNGLNFTLITTLGDLDLFGEITGGGGYKDLLSYSHEETAFGVTFLCLSLDRLIHVKRAARRPKDLEAIAELKLLLEEEQQRNAQSEPMPKNGKEFLVSAIQNRMVLRCFYNGKPRVIEPQAYGISTAGNEVLRVFQREGGSKSGQPVRLKLFEVAKISKLEATGEIFGKAQPEHNPNDSAMIEVFAALPAP